MRIAFIGLGEAAGAFISGWGGAMVEAIRTYDIKSDDPKTAGEIRSRAKELGLRLCGSATEALDGADLIFCTVTADQAVAAADGYAAFMEDGAVWCDLNSCAPQSKLRANGIVRSLGGRYLDVAVMAPVYPKRNLVPCLISGPDAAELAPILQGLPMHVRVMGDQVGRASSIKMVRSIMVKGMEALTAECALAATAAGVEDEVFPSLKSGHPWIDVPERAAYNFERTLVHGKRRAAEMDEVAKMLTDLGLPNGMAAATADWQRVLSGSGVALPADSVPDHRWFSQAYLQALGVSSRSADET